MNCLHGVYKIYNQNQEKFGADMILIYILLAGLPGFARDSGVKWGVGRVRNSSNPYQAGPVGT